jgi:hypothetical protein
VYEQAGADIHSVVEAADFHALRHTFLTLGGRAGIDLRTLQELAGHSEPELTVRYSHRRLHDLAGAVGSSPASWPNPTRKFVRSLAGRSAVRGNPGHFLATNVGMETVVGKRRNP